MAWKFNPNYNSLPEQVAENKEDIEKLKNIPDKVGTKVLKNAPGNPTYETLKLVGSDFINVDEDEFDPNQLDFRLDQSIIDMIDETVKSVKESEKVYATDNFGNPTTLQYNVNPYGDGLVKRSNDGRVKGKDGVEPDDLVNKKQLDSKPNFSDIPNVEGFIKNEPNAFDYNNLANKPNIPEGVKLYNDLGQNEDGAINQKAATNNFATKLELGLKQNVLSEQQILNINDVPNKANKNEIPTTLAELKTDSSHQTISESERDNWNAKSNFSGSYNNLTDKPTIPNKTSDLINDGDSGNGTYASVLKGNVVFDKIEGENNPFLTANLVSTGTVAVSRVNADTFKSKLGINPVLLWQNANINSGQSKQRITTANSSAYPLFLIAFKGSYAGIERTIEYRIFRPNKSKQGNMEVYYVSTYGGTNVKIRTIKYINDTTMDISDAQEGSGKGNVKTNNDVATVIAIYGVKDF